MIAINVTNIRKKFVLISKLDEANTLGINKKIEKGFKIPPVKYNSKLNWTISNNKKFRADLLSNCVFFIIGKLKNILPYYSNEYKLDLPVM